MLRNNCTVFIHFGDVRMIKYLPWLMFPEFNSVRREGVKVLHKGEQEGIFIFALMFEKHVHCHLNVHRLKRQQAVPSLLLLRLLQYFREINLVIKCRLQNSTYAYQRVNFVCFDLSLF